MGIGIGVERVCARDGFLPIEEAVAIRVSIGVNTVNIIGPFPDVAHAVAIHVDHLGRGTSSDKKRANQRDQTQAVR